MDYRLLGKTDIFVSRLAFGAGPISTLMVGDDGKRQRSVVEHAIARGINWFDTAATYGDGASETNLGRVLAELGAPSSIHVATKVRLMPDDLNDIRGSVRRSVEESLRRLRLERIALLQLHNSITARRGDEPTSITPADVLGSWGAAEAFEELRTEGRVMHLGLTGIGQPSAIVEVARSRVFAIIQTPYHLLNPSSGRVMPGSFSETNYGNIIGECARVGMGVFAIRVLAGGALAGKPPSPHTRKTPFFPLDLYERDSRLAERLQARLGPGRPLPREAVRFALAHPHVQSALIGFASTGQIDETVEAMMADEPPIDYEDVSEMAEDD